MTTEKNIMLYFEDSDAPKQWQILMRLPDGREITEGSPLTELYDALYYMGKMLVDSHTAQAVRIDRLERRVVELEDEVLAMACYEE